MMATALRVTGDAAMFATFANGIHIIVTDCRLSFLNVTAITALSPALTSFSYPHLLWRGAKGQIRRWREDYFFFFVFYQHCDKHDGHGFLGVTKSDILNHWYRTAYISCSHNVWLCLPVSS